MEQAQAVLETPAEEPVEQVLSDEQKVLKEYSNSLNMFIQKVMTYSGSKKQLQRVLTSLAVHPMNKEELKFSYPEEEDLFELGTRVNSAKFFLMVSGLENQGKIRWVDPTPPTEETENTENNNEKEQVLSQ